MRGTECEDAMKKQEEDERLGKWVDKGASLVNICPSIQLTPTT